METGYIFLIGNIILFSSLMLMAISVWKNYRKNNIAKKLINMAKESESHRKSYEEELRARDGNQDHNSLMFRLDLLLEGSGVKKRFHVATEIFIILVMVGFMLVFIVSSKIIGNLVFGLFISIFLVMGVFGLLKLLNILRIKKIEGQMLPFLNLLENYSRLSDDIIYIFGKVYPYIDDPLKTYIYECYYEAYNTGNADVAMSRLELKVQHPKLKDFIRNLSICSHHEANYETVINDSRKSIKIYLATAEERKSVTSNARMEIILISVIGMFMISMIGKVLGVNIIRFLLSSGIAGQLLFAYMAGILIYAFINMINLSIKGD